VDSNVLQTVTVLRQQSLRPPFLLVFMLIEHSWEQPVLSYPMRLPLDPLTTLWLLLDTHQMLGSF